MKKKILIIVGIVVLLVAAVGTYFFFFRKGGGAKIYSFADLKAAVELGIPLKCSYTIGETQSQGYIKGEKWHGKVKMADGAEGDIIMKDNCMWSWKDGETTGVKMCFEVDEGESMWDQSQDSGVEYVCKPAVFGDNVFDLPEDVDFMDTDELFTPTE